MNIDLADPAIPRLIVTGHPNHELAIFGLVQRLRPRLLFLTDGGSEERENESRRALASIDALDRARFLGWSEKSLYDALLFTDAGVLGRLVDDVRRELLAFEPRQVICESIELYNPLHDITLPIVRAAAEGLELDIIEFPLIAQEPAPGERYRVQRFANGRESVELTLDARELANKLHARDRHYMTLRRTMQAVLDGVPDSVSGVEHFTLAADALPAPHRDHVLRYEWRGRLLRERGEVDRVITFADHFEPAVALLGGNFSVARTR